MVTGQCECGSVRFEIDAVRETVTACHCSQCRRTSGHIWASTIGDLDKLKFTSEEGLKWFQSSDFAKRGFCENCGSSLFYRMQEEDNIIAISAGCLDDPSALSIGKHIFVKDKAAYYEITDEVPQIDKF